MCREDQKELRKQQMLAQCLELFVQQGLENTSINDLAKYCKTYKAAFYNYFASKDEIVYECAKMYMEKLGDMLFSEIASSKASLRAALERGFEVLAAEKNNFRYVYQVISSPKYGAQSRKDLSEIYSKYLNYSSAIAEKYGVDEEKFRPYYLLFIATMHDFCLWENAVFAKEKMDFTIDLLITMVVEEIADETGKESKNVLADFLCSKTGKALYDKETRLWCNGPSYIAELYMEEVSGK